MIKSPVPYDNPLSCLLSLFKQPPINSPWNADDLDDYMENQQFGLNVYQLVGNKAQLSVKFPGK